MSLESLYVILQCVMLCFFVFIVISFVFFVMFCKQKHLYDNELFSQEQNRIKIRKDRYYKSFTFTLKIAGICLFTVIIIWLCSVGFYTNYDGAVV